MCIANCWVCIRFKCFSGQSETFGHLLLFYALCLKALILWNTLYTCFPSPNVQILLFITPLLLKAASTTCVVHKRVLPSLLVLCILEITQALKTATSLPILVPESIGVEHKQWEYEFVFWDVMWGWPSFSIKICSSHSLCLWGVWFQAGGNAELLLGWCLWILTERCSISQVLSSFLLAGVM